MRTPPQFPTTNLSPIGLTKSQMPLKTMIPALDAAQIAHNANRQAHDQVRTQVEHQHVAHNWLLVSMSANENQVTQVEDALTVAKQTLINDEVPHLVSMAFVAQQEAVCDQRSQCLQAFKDQ